LVVAGGCFSDTDGFSSEEWKRIKMIEPIHSDAELVPPQNPFDLRGDEVPLAQFGQKLFWDGALAEGITVAGPTGAVGDLGKVSCATCHGSPYLAESRPISQSHGRSWLAHNTPSMVNNGWNKWTLWTGRFDSLLEHGAGALGTAATPLAQAHYLYKKYRTEYNTLFPDTPLDPALDSTAPDAARFPATGGAKANAAAADTVFEKMTKADQWKIHQIRANLARAFDAHPRKLNSQHSAFEKYISGVDRSEESFSSHAKNGLKLFIGKASCIDCHNGPTLSDGKFHNIGVTALAALPTGSTTVAAVDKGRGGAMLAGANNVRALLKANESIRALAAPESLISIGKDANGVDRMVSPDELPVFSGAGQFSDNSTKGLQVLNDNYAQSCPAGADVPDSDDKRAKILAAVCGGFFRAPKPEGTTPADVAGDPRYQICLDANADTKFCADLDASGALVSKFDPNLDGAFRTPQLLNVSETGPYFHTGEVKTLRDVVWHYNNGGGAPGAFPGKKSPELRPLLLTEAEMDDLVEFLKTLKGDVPAEWTCNPLLDPKAANACSWGMGTGGATGGAGGAGGGGGSKGGTSGSAGGAGGSKGGTSGSSGSGGASSSGGAPGTGGATPTGGAPGTGGVTPTGGATASGGATANGGEGGGGAGGAG